MTATIAKALARSSNIHSVGYDDETGELRIAYKHGGPDEVLRPTWRYLDVPIAVWNEMCAAFSVGSFVAAAIKPFYRASRIPDAELLAEGPGEFEMIAPAKPEELS